VTPEICPNCGAEVPPGAKACPECGSDEETGWAEDAHAGSLGLPDEDFDYREFVAREFRGEGRAVRRMRRVRWIAAGLLILMLLWFLIR
jgi:hypothetical protein